MLATPLRTPASLPLVTLAFFQFTERGCALCTLQLSGGQGSEREDDGIYY